MVRYTLSPQGQACLHAVDVSQVEEVVLRPLGYQWSPPLSVPGLTDSSRGAQHLGARCDDL